MTRTFHFKDGKSDKFWTITLAGVDYTVHFGRTGTSGQVQTKSFSSADEAQKAYDKLIREKLKGGYVEQSAGAAPPRPAPVAVPVPAPAPAPVQTEAPASSAATAAAPARAVEPDPAPRETGGSVQRVVHLRPFEWILAPWRETYVAPGSPAPFDHKAALERLQKVQTYRNWQPYPWHRLMRSPFQKEEGALFWLHAMVFRCLMMEKEREASLAKVRFDSRSAWQQALIALATDPLPSCTRESMESVLPRIQAPLSMFPLLDTLLPWPDVLALGALIARHCTQRNWDDNDRDTSFFEWLASLGPEKRGDLRAHASEWFRGATWPTDHTRPAHAFFIAAALGMEEEVKSVINAWPEKRFQGPTWNHRQAEPQAILFGLRSPEEMVEQFRRWKLELSEPLHIKAWLAHTEWRHLDVPTKPILALQNKEGATELAEVVALVQAPETAPHMLELQFSSKAQPVALKWFDQYPVEAAAGLLAVAAGRGKLADSAAEFVRSRVRRGDGALIERLITEAPKDVQERVRGLLAAGREDLPDLGEEEIPEGLAAAFAEAARLKQKSDASFASAVDLPPIVMNGKRLSHAHVELLMRALIHGSLAAPHPLALALRCYAETLSLDRFAWTLFESWLSVGAPSKDKWALHAVGIFGGDPSALKLAAYVRVWPGEAKHQTAALGLECLRSIGTDMALMQINGIAQKVKFQAIKQRANECMQQIAEDRGLSRSELEDRIVSDCGLDERSSRVFDFGPRKFQFVFGPGLKPMVRDESGALKPDLPKPTSKDDPQASETAITEWKHFKKQLAETIKQQHTRLEQVLVTGRRWTAEEFGLLLLKHPLMVKVIQPFVWGVYEQNGPPVATFRVTEDGTLADENDEATSLPDGKLVGLVHPLHLDEGTRDRWGQLLGDYELLPPFPQLGRTLHKLTEEEAGAREIHRYADVEIPGMSFVGILDRLGWIRGKPADGGVYCHHSKQFPGLNVTAVIEYPGLAIGAPDMMGAQKIEKCFFVPGLRKAEMYPTYTEKIVLGKLDPVIVGEVLRDLSVLASKGGPHA